MCVKLRKNIIPRENRQLWIMPCSGPFLLEQRNQFWSIWRKKFKKVIAIILCGTYTKNKESSREIFDPTKNKETSRGIFEPLTTLITALIIYASSYIIKRIMIDDLVSQSKNISKFLWSDQYSLNKYLIRAKSKPMTYWNILTLEQLTTLDRVLLVSIL